MTPHSLGILIIKLTSKNADGKIPQKGKAVCNGIAGRTQTLIQCLLCTQNQARQDRNVSSKTEIGLAFKEHTVWAAGDVEMNQIVTQTKVTLQL